MSQNFADEFAAKLNGHVPDECLGYIRETLRVELNKYDLVLKQTDLVPYTGLYPECYKVFFVTKKLEGASKLTLRNYKLFLDDMFETIRKPVKEITANDIKVYLYTYQQNHNICNSTLNTRRRGLRSFFSWAAAEQYIDRDPMATSKAIKFEENKEQPLDDMQMEQVRGACKNIREQAIIEFFYSTGCRVSEMEHMNISDVDFKELEVTLFGKGSIHRQEYLTAKSAILLKKYLDSRDDDSEALFVSVYKPHKRISSWDIEDIVKRIGKRAGIEKVHPHRIRKTMATDALQHGMEITQVQKLLGHANISTTMIYAKVADEDVKRSHKKYIA